MESAWHSAAAMKRLACVLLLLALAGIGVMHVAGQKMVAIQGPGTLRSIDDQTLWLAVNDELWVLDRHGRRTARVPVAQFGLSGGLSNIVPTPDGSVLLTSRQDRDWQVVDPGTRTRVRTIQPRWPQPLQDHARGAIHLAASPRGDIAVGTGGGHAVLLFDRDGNFKARTAPGTYYFTNGLSPSVDGWWSTDTNRAALHLLDGPSLAVKSTVRLPKEPPGFMFLGELIPSHGNPLPGASDAPLATVTRLDFAMEGGHAVDLFADGRQAVFNHAPAGQLRDIAWFDKQLLLVDGDSYEILRFGPDRLALEPFGDAQVRHAFQQMLQDRRFWASLSSRWGFLLSLGLLLAGVAAYSRHKKLLAAGIIARRDAPARSVAGASSAAVLVRQRLWIFGLPVALRLLAMLAGVFLLSPLLLKLVVRGAVAPHPLLSLNLLVLSVVVLVTPIAFWQQWRQERLSRDPRHEETLNHKALAWLRDHADWDRVAQAGESPRETLYLPGWKAQWLLVTNQRILLFAASARERRLQREWPRRALLYAGLPEGAPGAKPLPAWRRLLLPAPNLALHLADGTRLTLGCASAVTARRVAGLLMQTRAAAAGAAPVESRAQPGTGRRRWGEVAASFALPGLGQWLQDRFATGTVLFVAAVLCCGLVWGPVLWASIGPKTHVGGLAQLNAAFLWLLLSLAAAADAYHFSLRRTRTTKAARRAPAKAAS